MKCLYTITLLFFSIFAFAQSDTEYYRFPNTYLFILPPNDSFSSMDELVGIFNNDRSCYIRAEYFTLEEEPMIDQFYLKDFSEGDFSETEIQGGSLQYAWKKTMEETVHPDSFYIYGAKVRAGSRFNYVLMGIQKSQDEKTREQILHSLVNMKVDITQNLDPFAGKSFRVGLDQIPLKHCEALKSDWLVKLTSDGTEYPAGEDKSSILISAAFVNEDFNNFDGMAKSSEEIEILRKEELEDEPVNWKKYLLRDIKLEGVKIYSYWHVSSGKLYGIQAKIYPASPVTESEVDAFVRTFERTE